MAAVVPARVSIEATVWSDSRFEVLAEVLGMDRYEAIGRMAAIWAECTDRQVDVLPERLVAVKLRCTPDLAREALEISELGEAAEDGLRIRGCRGRIEWLAKIRSSASLGGKAKNAKGKGGNEPSADRHSIGMPVGTRSAPDRHAPGVPIGTDSLCPLDSSLFSLGSDPRGGASREHVARAHGATPEPAPDPGPALEPAPPPDGAHATNATWATREQARAVLVAHNAARERLGLKPFRVRDAPGGEVDTVSLLLRQYTQTDLRNAIAVREAEARAKRAEGGDWARWFGPGMWRAQNLADDIAADPAQREARQSRAPPGKAKERDIRVGYAPAPGPEYDWPSGKQDI